MIFYFLLQEEISFHLSSVSTVKTVAHLRTFKCRRFSQASERGRKLAAKMLLTIRLHLTLVWLSHYLTITSTPAYAQYLPQNRQQQTQSSFNYQNNQHQNPNQVYNSEINFLNQLQNASRTAHKFARSNDNSNQYSYRHQPTSQQQSTSRQTGANAPLTFSTRQNNDFYPPHSQSQSSPSTTSDVDFFEADSSSRLADCPPVCSCNITTLIANCTSRNLSKLPSVFPKEIKRIYLQHNNITEVGPFAFKGLKRLQRIDLSNNNIVKLDPLAFTGGLTSLNSLLLYSNKISQLPANIFSELGSLQLLLLNANLLQCINKDLFQSLSNLNLLSLHDNNIETLADGTFDGLKSIKTLHLGKNPLSCDCNLRWLTDFLEQRPIEKSEAKCDGPSRVAGKKLSELQKQRLRCEGAEQERTALISSQCTGLEPALDSVSQCPAGCVCRGATVDCSRPGASSSSEQPSRQQPQIQQSQPQIEQQQQTQFELFQDLPDDVPVFVTKVQLNDNRIKRIRATGLFRRLASSQQLDLRNNKIVGVEEHLLGELLTANGSRPSKVVFVLVEPEGCEATRNVKELDACELAPRVGGTGTGAGSPQSAACFNGGACVASPTSLANYTCTCPAGFAGALCEINVDDCVEHQCQNGAACVDAINGYRCVCRDPQTSGEFCELLNTIDSSAGGASASALTAPLALPMIGSGASNHQLLEARSILGEFRELNDAQAGGTELESTTAAAAGSSSPCKRQSRKQHLDDGNGCRSVKPVKFSECSGSCAADDEQLAPAWSTPLTANNTNNLCKPSKLRRKRIRMQCSDGASYVKTVELVRACACSSTGNDTLPFLNQIQDSQLPQLTASRV